MKKLFVPGVFLLFLSCSSGLDKKGEEYLVISRETYVDQLYGFWLGECIANWTGLVTEMDKIGNVGEIKTGDFYTREHWGTADQPSIWAQGIPSDLSETIDFVFCDSNEVWGSDDDTDIEYMYQYLLSQHDTSFLCPGQIRDGWLQHIKQEEENFLWVSNQRAFDLMNSGVLPPETGSVENNEHYDMIDAQLTTEIFGLFAPGRPDIAVGMAHLPIQTTAREDAEFIAKFYVRMHALASLSDTTSSMGERLRWMAEEARIALPDDSYANAMYAYVKGMYAQGTYSWEQCRDSIYYRYQLAQEDGYDLSSRNLYCNACFAAGINFAASLVSLFYGEGDMKETIKIGTLCGWDSDNPTATWGGLIGFMLGKEGVEQVFGRVFSNRYNIHRTRIGFPNDGMDTFEEMALVGLEIVDRCVVEEAKGTLDSHKNSWKIPLF